MNKLLLVIIILSSINSFVLADFLYCTAGVKIYHSKHSASLQQSNGTRANFEYYSKFKNKSMDTILTYRGTDIPGMLAIPKNTNGTVKVMLELDGEFIPFFCHK